MTRRACSEPCAYRHILEQCAAFLTREGVPGPLPPPLIKSRLILLVAERNELRRQVREAGLDG